jgi:hypothetical protein
MHYLMLQFVVKKIFTYITKMPKPIVCDGRARRVEAGLKYRCVSQNQVNKLPKATIAGLIKYRAKKKAEYNKKK